MDLVGKKVLFIGIGFYDYDSLIVRQFEKKGASVTYVCQEHPYDIAKKLKRFFPFKKFENWLSVSFLKSLLDGARGFDEVFVIKGDRLTKQLISDLKEKNPKAHFTMYQWDSFQRFNGDPNIFKQFDSVFSFDRVDCVEKGFKFLPLFYRVSSDRKEFYRYELSFVGWLHFNRLNSLLELKGTLSQARKNVYFYLYTSIKNWFYLKIMKNISFVHRKTLPYSEFLEVLENSNAIIDLHHPDQTGLTMRTIEALGANRKIITTNEDIVNYDFYSPSNHFVLKKNTPIDEITDFIAKPYCQIDSEAYNSYSFVEWFEKLFSGRV